MASLSNEEEDFATGEHKLELAGGHADFTRTVDRVQGAYDAQTPRNVSARSNTSRGLALVVIGGVAETIAAAIAAVARSS
jgi:hypothetical protein